MVLAARGRPRTAEVPERRRRPWTRTGAVAIGAHLFYELVCGVAVPFASRIGPVPATALYAAGTGLVLREAGRRPASRDPVFAALNGMFLSAVIAHFTVWPGKRVAGLPWLMECEGLSGRLMPPYNLILYVSAVAALGGLAENRSGAVRGALVPVALVPWLLRETPREYARLCAQAQERPGWWNRRLHR